MTGVRLFLSALAPCFLSCSCSTFYGGQKHCRPCHRLWYTIIQSLARCADHGEREPRFAVAEPDTTGVAALGVREASKEKIQA